MAGKNGATGDKHKIADQFRTDTAPAAANGRGIDG